MREAWLWREYFLKDAVIKIFHKNLGYIERLIEEKSRKSIFVAMLNLPTSEPLCKFDVNKIA